MNDSRYKFSVVIPIYNVEKYLEQSIKSIINQSIGFKKNIQLILVNDGSTDKSENICEYYKNEYPENIIYIKQKNQGVSSARNAGIKYIQGKYANFLDADDKWDYNVFEIVYDFFEQHQDEVDVVACRQKFFDAQEGYHKLDYKFDSSKIVNILEQYDNIQLSTSSSFIKRDVIKKYKYDERIEYSEDAILMAQILMENPKYGILPNAIYNYRKRKEKTSALQVRENKKSWYNETLEYGCKYIIEKSIEKYGRVIPYIQYQLMYDIQWRVKSDVSLFLNEKEREKYLNKLKEILKYIDDNIIMEQKFIWTEYKILTLCLKYNEDITKKLEYENGRLFFNKVEIYKLQEKKAINIKEIELHRKVVKIVGNITYFLPEEDYELFIKVNDKKLLINKFKIFKNEPSIIGKLKHYKQFDVKIPIKSDKIEINFLIDYKGEKNNLFLKITDKNNIEIKKIALKKCGHTLRADKKSIILKSKKRREKKL